MIVYLGVREGYKIMGRDGIYLYLDTVQKQNQQNLLQFTSRGIFKPILLV